MYRLFRPTWIAAILIAAIAIYMLATFAAMAQQAGAIKPVPLIPPAQYDHPYKGKLTMQVIKDPAELKELCKGTSKIACALFSLPRLADGSSATCRIIMLPDDVLIAGGNDIKIVLRHERAHCNGWGSDHAMPASNHVTVMQKTAPIQFIAQAKSDPLKDRQIASTYKRCLAERSDDSWKKTYSQKELNDFCGCFAVRSAPDNADVPKELAYCHKYLNLPDIEAIKKKDW